MRAGYGYILRHARSRVWAARTFTIRTSFTRGNHRPAGLFTFVWHSKARATAKRRCLNNSILRLASLNGQAIFLDYLFLQEGVLPHASHASQYTGGSTRPKIGLQMATGDGSHLWCFYEHPGSNH